MRTEPAPNETPLNLNTNSPAFNNNFFSLQGGIGQKSMKENPHNWEISSICCCFFFKPLPPTAKDLWWAVIYYMLFLFQQKNKKQLVRNPESLLYRRVRRMALPNRTAITGLLWKGGFTFLSWALKGGSFPSWATDHPQGTRQESCPAEPHLGSKTDPGKMLWSFSSNRLKGYL